MEAELQKVWTLYKEAHLNDGYLLAEVKAIYFPIWKCKQEIIITTKAPLDGFSQVILQTIAAGKVQHKDICAFLGIEEDSFVLGQFHYLLKQDWIRVNSEQVYSLTPTAKGLLDQEANIQQLKTMEFEYYTLEERNVQKGRVNLSFFDPKSPLSSKLSEAKQKKFKGYRIFQNNRLEQNSLIEVLPHHQNQAPNLIKLKEQRNDFAAFVKDVTGNNFYDFGKSSLKCHPHSLCFLELTYKKEGVLKNLTEVRQFSKSVFEFDGFELEDFFR